MGGPRVQLVTALGFTGLVLAFSLVSNVPLAVVLLFLAGAASSAFLALNQTELQLSVEDEVRGRVLSIYLLTWGMLPIGQLLVGTVAGQVGTPLAMVLSCAVAIVTIVVLMRRFPSVRE